MTDDSFHVERRQLEGVTTMHVAGDVDAATGPHFLDELAAAIAEEPRRIDLDLRGVEFMDSTGLNILVMAHKHARSRGTDMFVIERSIVVARVMTLTGLDELLVDPDR